MNIYTIISKMCLPQLASTDLHGVQRAACALGVELDPPNFLSRVRSRFDALDRRIITVDEEWFPPCWEWICQFERILMVLAGKKMPISQIIKR